MSETAIPLPDTQGIVKTPKEFSDALTQELSDEQIKRAFEIMMKIKSKWEEKFRRATTMPLFSVEDAMELIDKFEEELKYELATRLHVYATVDATPIFEGEPPIIEFQGALPSHEIAKYGFDHERKTYEVKKATVKGEDFLGQKEQKRLPKSDAKSTRPS